MVKRDWSDEYDKILTQYEDAKEAYFALSNEVTTGMAKVAKGNATANPSMSLIEQSLRAKERWETSKTRLHDFIVEWSRSTD